MKKEGKEKLTNKKEPAKKTDIKEMKKVKVTKAKTINKPTEQKKELKEDPVIEQKKEIEQEDNIVKETKEFLKNNENEIKEFVKGSMITPISNIKENSEKFKDLKNVLIGSGLLVIIAAVLNFITTFIAALFVKEVTLYGVVTKLSFEPLKYLNYFDLLIKNIFVFALIIAGLAGVYYLGLLIMKKDIKYHNILGIISTSFIPTVIISLFIAPLIKTISSPIGTALIYGGLIYSMLIFVKAIEIEVKFKDDDKHVIFHTVCTTIIILLVFFLTKGFYLNDFINSLPFN